MAEKAIDRMKGHKVALYQIESGKVGRSCKWYRWFNSRSNSFDEAVKVAMDFAEKTKKL
jgi:hypothetical protein